MNQLINAMKMHAMQGMSGFTGTRQGVITAYDPDSYSVKVQIQPTGEETGWIPLSSPWVGNGWGLAAGPMIDAVVELNFDTGTIGVGMVSGQFYNDVDRCPGPPSGEFWLIHKSGSLLKFHNDGTVQLVSEGTLTTTAPQWNHNGPVNISGNVVINGSEQVTGQITGQGGMAVSGGSGASVTGDMRITGGDVSADNVTLKTLKVTNVQSGSSISGVPVQ